MELHEHIDWILAIGDLLTKVGLANDTCIVGSGPGGAFATEVAIFWPHKVSKSALIAPWGIFDEHDPMADPWGQRKPELEIFLCKSRGLERA